MQENSRIKVDRQYPEKYLIRSINGTIVSSGTFPVIIIIIIIIIIISAFSKQRRSRTDGQRNRHKHVRSTNGLV